MVIGARHQFAIGLVCGWLAVVAPGSAQDLPPIPHHGSASHLGVASCASSACHGAATPAQGGTVLQNEYATWQTNDRHAKAYSLLFDELSVEIARKLGLEAAHTAKVCLDCHADNVAEERRGPQFQLTDGIGCEACHGGAEDWIRSHTVRDDPTSHRRNLAAGLYPTNDPVARAELCLSCHLGDETKLVTHRLMGAGHPRLTFELDTFTTLQPAHFVVDDDYRARKPVAGAAKTWAVGQAVALVQTLDGVLDPEHGRAGLFPELTFFDCYSCHKPISADSWQERASLGLGPGVVRFNDANLIMLRVAAGVVAPELGKELEWRGRALHQATRASAAKWTAAANELRAVAQQAVEVFAQHDFTEQDLSALLVALVKEGERGEYIDYVAAEQNTMAIGAVLTSMLETGAISAEEYEPVEQVMADLYAAVAKDEQYRPSTHLAALRRVRAAAMP
ncbi:MAG TPA: multiheme c-type cytochrome [Geminicoccaceae bacterium]|nr:multiheme c-type cytochrome [Geminicoccaceae bacterium]